ncbi:MAG: acetyltransferase, GNAT family [uncultured bacterium]|nr:MAG: acetyltransferase, GNAT family [uncultured bacterium]
MKYCQPSPHHFEQIFSLQNKNLISVVDQKDRQNGFLSTIFTQEQFQVMNKSLGIMVALKNDVVCGYLCATTIEFNQAFSFPAAMIKNCEDLFYQNRSLNAYQYFIASPMCIDKNFRGKEVFLNLCKALLAIIPKQYELAVSLISTENNRSLSASKKAGAKIIKQFEEQNKKFWILLFELNELRRIF